MRRQNVPDKIAVEVLVANQHTCCICRERRKHIQLHHIDGDTSNNAPSNVAVLCLDDHSRVTGNEGLGRRFTLEEVKIYKFQWEQICACVDSSPDEDDHDEGADEEPDEPVDSIYQSRRICAEDECAFAFAMEAGQELVCSISADDYVDVSICSAHDYRKWLDGEDLREYVGEEDVRECELPTFVAPRDGKYMVAVINNNDEDVDVTVDLSVWAAEGDEDDEDQED